MTRILMLGGSALRVSVQRLGSGSFSTADIHHGPGPAGSGPHPAAVTHRSAADTGLQVVEAPLRAEEWCHSRYH